MYNTLLYEVLYKFHTGKVADPGRPGSGSDSRKNQNPNPNVNKTGSGSDYYITTRIRIRLSYNNSHLDPTIVKQPRF